MTSRWKRALFLTVSGLLFSATSGANAPAGRYVAGPGTVQDSKTGLTWEQPATMALAWSDAKSYCTSKGAGWRLPKVKELLTLVDFNAATAEGVHIDGLFTGTPGDVNYWSSTLVAGSSTNAWAVSFGAPGPSSDATTAVGRVRCVR